MQVKVQYFAALKQASGMKEELVAVNPASTVAVLYELLSKKYSFPYAVTELRVAVNEEFSNFDHCLQDDDSIVFIPPVAGG